MGPIVLLKNFTFALAPGDSFTTDWTSFPSEHQFANMHYSLQTLTPAPATNGVSLELETSYDAVEHPSALTMGSIVATGSDNGPITSGLAALVRLLVKNDDSNALFGTISVWLQPKSE